MRKDFLLFLSFLVDAGYIVSFRVTKDKIFITVGKYYLVLCLKLLQVRLV